MDGGKTSEKYAMRADSILPIYDSSNGTGGVTILLFSAPPSCRSMKRKYITGNGRKKAKMETLEMQLFIIGAMALLFNALLIISLAYNIKITHEAQRWKLQALRERKRRIERFDTTEYKKVS